MAPRSDSSARRSWGGTRVAALVRAARGGGGTSSSYSSATLIGSAHVLPGDRGIARGVTLCLSCAYCVDDLGQCTVIELTFVRVPHRAACVEDSVVEGPGGAAPDPSEVRRPP